MKIFTDLSTFAISLSLLAIKSMLDLLVGSLTNRPPLLIKYFPNWLYETYLPSQIDFNSYTHINYAFAEQVANNTPIWEDTSIFDASANYSFQTLLSLANSAGTKVLVSVGGWTGSTQFSTMAATAAGRAEFIQWNVDFITQYGTAGVDLDWEYPTDAGPGCNTYSSDDVNNLLSLVQELRASLDSNFPDDCKEITMAVHITPWVGDEIVTTDVSAFVPYVDRFHVLAYDINGPWNSTSGPNAPFMAQPGFGYPYGFVEDCCGIPFYGRSQTLLVTSPPTTQYNPAVSPNAPLGDADDGPFTNPYCPSDTSAASGEWKYKNLRSQGVLTSPTTAAFPWARHFDNYTQTPWLYNLDDNRYLSYDDVVSVGVKTNWAIENDLAGLFCWSVDQDNGELLAVMQPVLSNNKRAPA